MEHFEEVLNCPDPLNPSDPQPGPDLQLHTGNIISMGVDNIPAEALKKGEG